MTGSENILNLFRKYGGYLTAASARERGIANKVLQRMTQRGLIERVAHGLYVSADTIPDTYFIAQYRCPKGVFSHETALYLHGFCDRVPLVLAMTVPLATKNRLLSEGETQFFYCKSDWMEIGLTTIMTFAGNEVTVYDMERTLCDCLRRIDKLDRDLVLTALKRYSKSNVRDNVKLLEYASRFKIRDMVYRYLEVL